ncbi:MAG: carbohydrate kinase [Methylococcales bacterium]|nr:carbohydrate kinase [Methylococcales bacterium]
MTKQKTSTSTAGIAIFGEVLIDQFPDGLQVLGGAPFNVAWHLQAFGQQPCFISRTGDDAIGHSIRQAMTDWGLSTENMQLASSQPTGTVKVSFVHDEPHYEILADQAYDFIDAKQLPQTDNYSIIYHGTLALRNPVSKQALDDLLAHHQGKVFIDVNLRAPWWQQEQVHQWLARANWVKLNHEELLLLTPPDDSLRDRMAHLLARHGLECLVVTCGSSGAIALNKDGEFIEVSPEPGLSVVDTVGAGDAFAAVLLLGMEKGWPLAVLMERAQSFASALVGQRGATVQNVDFYQPFIHDWCLA